MTIRCYSDLVYLKTFDERFAYLKLDGSVGRSTFGFDRYVNQRFYTSPEWRSVRNVVILRDNGCDLGIPGYEVHVNILIHHVNPVSVEDIVNHEEWIFDPEFLITTCYRTHNALHFGSDDPYPKTVVERSKGDTQLW